MKKAFLVVFIFINTFSNSQNLTLNDLFGICHKNNWDQVNEILSNKGWEYHASTKGDDEHYSTITWSYNKEEYTDKAQGWFYLFTFDDLPSKATYQFFNKKVYLSIKSNIATAGMKLVENSIEDNELIAKYENTNFIAIIKTAKRKNEESYSEESSITAYTLVLVNKRGVYDDDNGPKKEYYENGMVKAEYNLISGKITGLLKVYWENGNLKIIKTYFNGKENGKFTEYNDRGEKTAEGLLKEGVMTGLLTIYENGNKSQEFTKVNGINHGKYVEYFYDDENILYSKAVGGYLDGKKSGIYNYYLLKEGKENLIAFVTYAEDEKNGPFKEYVNSDSLEEGTYKNGILNGYFKRKTKMTGYEFKDNNKDISEEIVWWNLQCEGNYINGVQEGKWIYYLFGGKSEIGNYKKGKRTGKWTEYVRMGNYTDSIWKETTYENDLEDGLFVQYYDFKTVEDTSAENYSMKFINTPIYESCYFKGGFKEGQFILKDSAGNLISSGIYNNDVRNGIWIESYLMGGTDGNMHRIYLKGKYSNGEKNGIWEEYVNEGEILERQTYMNGELDGSLIRYDSKKKSQVFHYKKGQLLSLEYYDSLETISYKFQINSINEKVINCLYTDYHAGGFITKGYEFVSSSEEFNPYYFDFDFTISVSDTIQLIEENANKIGALGKSGWKREGFFEFVDTVFKQVRIVGAFKDNLPSGTWKKYYYKNNVYKVQNFVEGKSDVINYYVINSNNPFSGRLELMNENNTIISELKISNGLLDGKAKYYDDNGVLTKTEKYEQGVLKN